MELELEMAGRIRRHLLTSLNGLGVAALGIAASSSVSHALSLSGVALATTLSIAAIPAFVSFSAWRNLRCPACEGPIALQVVVNHTPLGELASKSCPHCGEPVFDRDLPRRFAAMVSIVASLVLGVGLLGTMVTGYRPLVP